MKSNINQATDNIFDRAKQAKSIIDVMREYYPSHTLTLQAKNQYRTKSIYYPGDNDTCTVIFTDTNTFHDYKSDKSGDIIDLIADVTNQTLIDTARSLANDSGYTSEYIDAKKSYELSIEKKYLKCHENLKKYSDILSYLHSRKISDETIEKFKIGALVNSKTGELRISIPYFDERGTSIIYGTTRRFSNHDSAKYLKEFIPQGLKDSGYSEPLMYLNTINVKDKSLLIIGEGVFDILSAVQEGYSGLCYVGGSTNATNLPVIQRFASQFKKVVLTFDNDKNKIINSGQNFTLKTANHLLQCGITNFYAVRDYGESNKDVSDFYSAGGELSELFSNAVNGVTFTTKIFTEKRPLKGDISTVEKGKNKKELKEFYLQLQKTLSDDDDLMNECKEIFESKYSRNSVKEFAKDKSEWELVQEYAQSIISKYHPKSYGESTHREYFVYQGDESGYWRNYSNGDLWSLIIKEHGINNILAKKVEDAIYSDPHVKKFDDEIINFGTPGFLNLQNGVLNLKTNEILPHDAKYMFDYVLPVKFDKNAKCPLFEKFLDEFSNFNTGRLQTIKDMIGYIFTFEDKEHRIFNLFGEGRNGKGTLFRVFDAIFGKYSTHLSPTQMLSAFERIKLQNSLINISTDINVRIDNKACEYLKRVSGGDMIDGNLKYKNSKDFSSHATLILAFNKTPLFEDNSTGFYDRHIYIKCENRFKGRENLRLDKDLQGELSGIFNYFLECARDFVENGCRVRQYEVDAIELSKKIAVENDIVASFLDDIQEKFEERISRTFTTNEVYEMFVEWLDETRNRKTSIPRKKLTSEIKRLTGLETRQAGAGENRGKYVFDFSPLIEKETQQFEVVSDTESEMQKQWDNFITFAKSKGRDYPDEIAGRVEFNYSIQDFRDYWLKSAENDRQKGDENGAGISLEHAQIAIEFLRQAG